MGRKSKNTPKRTRAGTEYDNQSEMSCDEMEDTLVPAGTQLYRTPVINKSPKVTNRPSSSNYANASSVETNNLILQLFDKIKGLEARLEARENKDTNEDLQGEDKHTRPEIVESAKGSINVTPSNVVVAKEAQASGVVRLPRGGFLKNPFQDIEFTGDSDKQNPLRFLRKFEKIAAYEQITDPDLVYYFEKTLKGNANVWFNLREPESYEQAKTMFQDKYWGEEIQARFRERLYTGRFRPNSSLSMADYAQQMAIDARTLDPPMSDAEVIRVVKRHFGTEISREIRPTTVNSIDDLTKLLTAIESERKFNTRKNDFGNERKSDKNATRDVKNYTSARTTPNNKTSFKTNNTQYNRPAFNQPRYNYNSNPAYKPRYNQLEFNKDFKGQNVTRSGGVQIAEIPASAVQNYDTRQYPVVSSRDNAVKTKFSESVNVKQKAREIPNKSVVKKVAVVKKDKSSRRRDQNNLRERENVNTDENSIRSNNSSTEDENICNTMQRQDNDSRIRPRKLRYADVVKSNYSARKNAKIQLNNNVKLMNTQQVRVTSRDGLNKTVNQSVDVKSRKLTKHGSQRSRRTTEQGRFDGNPVYNNKQVKLDIKNRMREVNNRREVDKNARDSKFRENLKSKLREIYTRMQTRENVQICMMRDENDKDRLNKLNAKRDKMIEIKNRRKQYFKECEDAKKRYKLKMQKRNAKREDENQDPVLKRANAKCGEELRQAMSRNYKGEFPRRMPKDAIDYRKIAMRNSIKRRELMIKDAYARSENAIKNFGSFLSKRRKFGRDPDDETGNSRTYKNSKEKLTNKNDKTRRVKIENVKQLNVYQARYYEDSNNERRIKRYNKNKNVAKFDQQIDNFHNVRQSRRRDRQRFDNLNLESGQRYTVQRACRYTDEQAHTMEFETVTDEQTNESEIISGRYDAYECDEQGQILQTDSVDLLENHRLEYYNDRMPNNCDNARCLTGTDETQQSDGMYASSEIEDYGDDESVNKSCEGDDYFMDDYGLCDRSNEQYEQNYNDNEVENSSYSEISVEPIIEEPEESDSNESSNDSVAYEEIEEEIISVHENETSIEDETDDASQDDENVTYGIRYANNRVEIMRTQQLLEELEKDMLNEQNKKLKSLQIPMIRIRFEKVEATALIDTGAQVSAITKELYDELVNAKQKMDIIPIRKFTLKGAFNERGVLVNNKVRLRFKIEELELEQEFYIVEKLAYNIVIGVDCLVKHKVELKCDEYYGIKFHENESCTRKICALTELDVEIELGRIFEKYPGVFSDEIGCATHYKHRIEVNTEAPYKKKTYPVPEKHLKAVREHIKDLESKGIVEQAATQYINPLVVVVKKNGEIRLCLDARELNKRILNDHAQPPTVEEVFRRVGSKRYFTTLDVASAFWQLPLEKKSKQYTGFLFDGQTYVFKRMPFGLKTAGASFTRAMHKAVGDENSDFMIIYLDDILIASNTLEEHFQHLEIVIKKLEQNGFKLNMKKCEFVKSEIKFLGHTFNEIQTEINDETRLAVQNFEVPKNKKGVQSFLGLVNWDRRFIKNLARMTKPIEALLKKNIKFKWESEQQQAFNDIKRAFVEAPNLYLTKPNYKFGIFVDAAKTGLGARLYQYDPENEHEKLTLAYASRSLKGAEKNYTVTELECLALVWSLKKWHTMLLGRHVKVHTDHRALQFLSTCITNNGRIARWFEFMQEFDLEIVHIPGKDNVIADSLSRQNKNSAEVYDDEKNIAIINDPLDATDTSEWVAIIGNAQYNDDDLIEAAAEYPESYYLRDELIRCRADDYYERTVVPRPIAWEMIENIHKYLLHYGTDKIISFAKRYFYIQNLERIARDVVASCEICQATKYYTRATEGEQYYVLPDRPGQTVSIDIFGPLPQSQNKFKYILVIMDQFSKYTKLYPMENQILDTIMNILVNDYFQTVGMPEEILTDNGGQFLTNRWHEFAEDCEFAIKKTTPYNPQSNPVERVMRELGRIIRTYASDNHDEWDQIIDRAEAVINATAHVSTGFAPDELHMDGRINLEIDPILRPEQLDSYTRDEKIIIASQNLENAARKRKVQFDKRQKARIYQVGDLVWHKVHRRSDASRRTTRKIHIVYDGPYRVEDIIRPNAYLLSDGNVYNSRQLKPHREARYRDNNFQRNNSFQRVNNFKINKRVNNLNCQSQNRFVNTIIKNEDARNIEQNCFLQKISQTDEMSEIDVVSIQEGNQLEELLNVVKEKYKEINEIKRKPIRYDFRESENKFVERKLKPEIGTIHIKSGNLDGRGGDKSPKISQSPVWRGESHQSNPDSENPEINKELETKIQEIENARIKSSKKKVDKVKLIKIHGLSKKSVIISKCIKVSRIQLKKFIKNNVGCYTILKDKEITKLIDYGIEKYKKRIDKRIKNNTDSIIQADDVNKQRDTCSERRNIRLRDTHARGHQTSHDTQRGSQRRASIQPTIDQCGTNVEMAEHTITGESSSSDLRAEEIQLWETIKRRISAREAKNARLERIKEMRELLKDLDATDSDGETIDAETPTKEDIARLRLLLRNRKPTFRGGKFESVFRGYHTQPLARISATIGVDELHTFDRLNRPMYRLIFDIVDDKISHYAELIGVPEATRLVALNTDQNNFLQQTLRIMPDGTTVTEIPKPTTDEQPVAQQQLPQLTMTSVERISPIPTTPTLPVTPDIQSTHEAIKRKIDDAKKAKDQQTASTSRYRMIFSTSSSENEERNDDEEYLPSKKTSKKTDSAEVKKNKGGRPKKRKGQNQYTKARMEKGEVITKDKPRIISDVIKRAAADQRRSVSQILAKARSSKARSLQPTFSFLESRSTPIQQPQQAPQPEVRVERLDDGIVIQEILGVQQHTSPTTSMLEEAPRTSNDAPVTGTNL